MSPTLIVGSFLDEYGPLFRSFVLQLDELRRFNTLNLRTSPSQKNRRSLPRKHTKGSPFVCFDILQHYGCQNIPTGPPFFFLRHGDTIQKSHFNFFSESFQNLRRVPLHFFYILQPTGVSQSPKGPPFTILSLRYSADFGRSRLVSHRG